MTEQNIAKINEVIAEYFKTTSKEDWVPAKKLMPALIKAEVFIKDEKNGMPLRRVFRELDKENALAKIPSLHAERSGENTYWYLVRVGATYVAKDPKDTGVPKGQQRKAARASSDEHYVINLCDELFNEKASRQHKFGFILGDYHKDGKTRTALPVDAYYKGLNLVLEFTEKQLTEGVDFFDKPEKKTISGVNRTEQRKIYDQRRRKGLKANSIQLLEIDYSSFLCDNEKQLIRELEKDKEVLNRLLKDFIN